MSFSDYLNNTFSNLVADSIYKVFEIVYSCTTSNLIETTIQSIKLFENSITINEYFTQHEKNIVLTTTAVCKFSLIYLNDANINPYSELNIWREDYETEENEILPSGLFHAAAMVIMDALTAAKLADEGKDTEEIILRSAAASMGIAAGVAGGILGWVGNVVATIVSWIDIF